MSPRGQKSATFIGTWYFPSGNSVDVYVWRDGLAFHTLHLWDSGPPLTPADEGYYRDVVRPRSSSTRIGGLRFWSGHSAVSTSS